MQAIQEERELPRFTKDFIGKGHQLEEKKRQRRRVEMEERALANRVLFLEKEEMRAEKALIKKRQQLNRIVTIAERQTWEKEEKERILAERERQVEKAREENRLRRLQHRHNQQQSMQSTLQRNSLDYQIAKKMLESGEKRKQLEHLQNLTSRKERYMTLNLMKDQGRSRIDKYFKKKNKEHTRLYLQKISQEEQIAKQKQTTIGKLAEIQGVLRKQLEQSSLKVTQLEQIIGDVTKSVKNRSLSLSRASQRTPIPHSSHYEPPTLITSIEGELLGGKEVEEHLEEGQVVQGGVSEGGGVRKRRRNKHANRYKQYEIF